MAATSNKDEMYDISDSTDWLNTPLASLAPIDASLRCQVCKDFYKTPMITSCSHTFCSLCIRRCLANDGRCPACRTTEQENKLRSNWAIESLVDEFTRARPSLLVISQRQVTAGGSHSPKRKFAEAKLDNQGPDQPQKRTRASSRLSEKSHDKTDVVVLDADTSDDDYQPDGLAACPVCRTRMKVEAIDFHLNKCLIQPSIPRSLLDPRSKDPQSRVSYVDKHSKSLPQLNYSLLKDTALRKKLQELGISTQGSRPLLEKRHTEWVTLWNANCDASRPCNKADLLHELEVWERTQGARVSSSSTGTNSSSKILRKDFDGAGWAAKHDLSFQSLIASARKNLVASKGHPTQDTKNGEADEKAASEALIMPIMPLPTGLTSDGVVNDSPQKSAD